MSDHARRTDRGGAVFGDSVDAGRNEKETTMATGMDRDIYGNRRAAPPPPNQPKPPVTQFLGKTRPGPAYVPRPKKGEGVYRYSTDADLARLQDEWDAAEAWAKHNDDLRAERLAAEEATRDAARREAEERTEAAFVDGLRQRYLAVDPAASEADFKRDLPEIRRQLRIAAAADMSDSTAADAAARRAMSQRYRG